MSLLATIQALVAALASIVTGTAAAKTALADFDTFLKAAI